jgi:hypothetical protein
MGVAMTHGVMSPMIQVECTQSTFVSRFTQYAMSPVHALAWFSLFLIFTLLPCFLCWSLLAFASCKGIANDAPVTSAAAKAITIAKVVWFTFHYDNS